MFFVYKMFFNQLILEPVQAEQDWLKFNFGIKINLSVHYQRNLHGVPLLYLMSVRISFEVGNASFESISQEHQKLNMGTIYVLIFDMNQAWGMFFLQRVAILYAVAIKVSVAQQLHNEKLSSYWVSGTATYIEAFVNCAMILITLIICKMHQ